MKLNSVDFVPGRIGQTKWGWVCRVYFKVSTVNQFTQETHCAFDGARWWWLAYLRAMRKAKRLHKRLAAKPGMRAAIGWRG